MTSPNDIKYSYLGVPTLQRFAQSNARIRGILGPFRSGKSSASVVEIVNRGLAQRPGPDGIRRTRFIVVRNTFAQLEDSTIKTVHMWLPPAYFGKYTGHNHTYTIKAFENCEIEIWFRALDRPDHVRNLLSVEVTGAWFNEAREIPWAIVEAMDGRIGQYPPKFQGGPTWQGLWLDTNPPDIDSKWYKFFEETTHDPSRVEIFRQPSGLSKQAENLNNLPRASYYQDLAYGKGDDWINVYIHGQYGFVREGKAVFRDYSDRLHCQEVDPVSGPAVIRGWDFGLTPACVFSQVLPDGRWLVFDEMVSENMGIARFSNEVLEHCAKAFPPNTQFEDYGDPAGQQRAQTDERTVFEIMQGKGINIEGGEQGLNVRLESVRYALNTLRDGEPVFILHPRCKTLRKAFQGAYHYRRMQTTAERYTSEPEKDQWSHPMDALQYPATRLFGGLIMGAQPADDDWPEPNDYAAAASRSEFTGY